MSGNGNNSKLAWSTKKEVGQERKSLKLLTRRNSLYMFRLGLSMALLATFLRQSYVSLDKFLSGEVTSTFQTVEMDRQPFPAISFCGLRDKLWIDWPNKKPTFQEALEDADEPDFLNYYSHVDTWGWLFNNTPPSWTNNRVLNRFTGKIDKCLTYRPASFDLIGRENQFVVDANATTMGIGEIYLHHRDHTLLTRTRNFGRTILRISPFPPLTQSRATDYVITIKKKKFLSKDDLPCDEDDRVNVDECLLDYFERNNSCVLPWRQKQGREAVGGGEEEDDEEEVEFEFGEGVCNDQSVFDNFVDFVLLLGNIGEKRIYQLYSVEAVYDQMSDEPYYFDSFPDWPGFDWSPIFYVEQSSVVFEKEVLLFDLSDFVANVGGYLGLLLGASLLSLYDDTKKIIEYASAKFFTG